MRTTRDVLPSEAWEHANELDLFANAERCVAGVVVAVIVSLVRTRWLRDV